MAQGGRGAGRPSLAVNPLPALAALGLMWRSRTSRHPKGVPGAPNQKSPPIHAQLPVKRRRNRGARVPRPQRLGGVGERHLCIAYGKVKVTQLYK